MDIVTILLAIVSPIVAIGSLILTYWSFKQYTLQQKEIIAAQTQAEKQLIAHNREIEVLSDVWEKLIEFDNQIRMLSILLERNPDVDIDKAGQPLLKAFELATSYWRGKRPFYDNEIYLKIEDTLGVAINKAISPDHIDMQQMQKVAGQLNEICDAIRAKVKG